MRRRRRRKKVGIEIRSHMKTATMEGVGALLDEDHKAVGGEIVAAVVIVTTADDGLSNAIITITEGEPGRRLQEKR